VMYLDIVTALIYVLFLASEAVAETKDQAGISSSVSIPVLSTVVLNPNETNFAEVQGWTCQPDGRGSLDIIISCCTTIFLCCWSVLCINVPPSHWGRKRSVQDFHSSGFTSWSLKHAFLSDMGGFSLKATDFVEFPLNAKQVHYLVTHNYIQSRTGKLTRHHGNFTEIFSRHSTLRPCHHVAVRLPAPSPCVIHTYRTQKLCEFLHWLSLANPPEKLLIKWAAARALYQESPAPTTTKPSKVVL
jgi:hypothetical protein